MRLRLVPYKGMFLTPDTAAAVQSLEEGASRHGWRVLLDHFRETPPERRLLALEAAGREVRFSLTSKVQPKGLDAAWGFAVPLGFTPWLRHPLEGPGDNIFHFFGPWRALYDNLMAEGRGHLSWPSLCAAAQVDVGVWKGTAPMERFVQAQIHRLGVNCGPVDGMIGNRTAKSLEALGVGGLTLAEAAERLKEAKPPEPLPGERGTGFISVPGRQVTVAAAGGVVTRRTPTGIALTVRGPGRVIVDVGAAT